MIEDPDKLKGNRSCVHEFKQRLDRSQNYATRRIAPAKQKRILESSHVRTDGFRTPKVKSHLYFAGHTTHLGNHTSVTVRLLQL